MQKESNKDQKNTKQDVSIAETKVELSGFKERLYSFERRFNTFVKNDFWHLVERVEKIHDKLFYGFILGIASLIITQIVLNIFK